MKHVFALASSFGELVTPASQSLLFKQILHLFHPPLAAFMAAEVPQGQHKDLLQKNCDETHAGNGYEAIRTKRSIFRFLNANTCIFVSMSTLSLKKPK